MQSFVHRSFWQLRSVYRTQLRNSVLINRRSFAESSRDLNSARIKPRYGRHAAVLLGLTFGIYYVIDRDAGNYSLTAIQRSTRTGLAVSLVLSDYLYSLRLLPKIYGLSDEEYAKIKSECHQRSANRLLWLCLQNGGIYIKLGQHIAALTYLLPFEYTERMKVLQDKCRATSKEGIEEMFYQDTGSHIDQVFSEFDMNPVGVASLAQVHVARLKDTGQKVAVKVQHPSLDKYTEVDIKICALFVRIVKKVFPEFEFDWVAEELQENLPKELDFVNEARNAARVSNNFRNKAVIKIPDVYWAQRRILCMEFIEGGKVDDLNYLQRNGINPFSVSSELSRLYSEMIFDHGFVHCDPHPGNIFVRPIPSKNFFTRLFHKNPYNFEVVLLDHGIYRVLNDRLRLDYAKLWIALINFDEKEIEACSYRLFAYDDRVRKRRTSEGLEYHRIFASMLTGRSWEVISKQKGGSITSPRSVDELKHIQEKISSGGFFVAISEVLAALPREMLLLFKSNDLLRSVDESLKVTKPGSPHLLRTLSVMGWYCAKAVQRDSMKDLGILSLRYWKLVYNYVVFGARMVLLEIYVSLSSFS